MTRAPEPTDPEKERALGRIPIWLDPADAALLSEVARVRWGEIPDSAPEDVRAQWARIVFRLSAARHKGVVTSDE